ncbi:MAG: PKD-like domain-containing protein [Chitinophagaceae bacterium]
MRKLYKLILPFFFVIAVQNNVKAQTALVAGDVAFTGYISSDPGILDQFSFVLLKNVTANTVIKFTDFGWRPDLGAFINRNGNLETEYTFTTNAAYNAGTEITIVSNVFPAAATATLIGGGSAGTVVNSVGATFLASNNMSLSGNGDQIFAYQGTFAAPTFITGIHMNVYSLANGDPVTAGNTSAANWDGVISTPATSENSTSSGLPAGLITGTNAIWIGTVGSIPSEEDNGHFTCGPDVSTIALARAAINNPANWFTSDVTAGFTLPTGCNYIGILASPPVITLQPSPSTICAGANTSFTMTATGAVSYQWQVDQGAGFVNLSNDATYSNVTTTTLNITAAGNGLNGFLYRCAATNGSGTTNTNSALLTVTPLAVNPTLNVKTPATVSVADGTPVSATFNAGSGGTGCSDDYRYTVDGGATYLPYTPGNNISTTGLAAGSGYVFIEGRRATCTSLCPGTYIVLAAWYVTPLPAGATTLNAGDIAFSGYTSTTTDAFSFVLLRNIGPNTVINFTDNGWLSTNVLQVAEQTVTWTSNAAYPAGTEIIISGLTATLAAGGSAGTVTGTALSLITGGDQVLAYRGSAASPTFISAIHMNVYSIANGDPVTTTAAAWDGTANTTSSSALPTGLTTGVNAIWIGTQDVIASEFDNARYGTCAGPGTLGPITTLRAALNNQANWIRDNLTPPGFTIPTGCLYFGLGSVPTITLHPVPSTVCAGTNTSFTITASGAISYQWQVDQGAGFINLSNDIIYSGVTTTTLSINATPIALNGFLYRCVATNVSGPANSNSALLTVNAVPVNPTIATKTPPGLIVADGTPVSATFNAGSGGTGCTDDFRYTIDGGVTYLPYTPGNNISTTGVSAGSGFVVIEGRRAACSSACQGAYTLLASWNVTPPVAPGATTLVAGDIAFSAYTSTTAGDDFSFVLLRNIGAATVINFTDNGWIGAPTNAFRAGEQNITWTAPAGGLAAGTEIMISGLTATKSGGGAAGTVTGTALSLNTTGDQLLAFQGLVSAPTFISAIHMNVYTVANGDPVSTTAAAWDGTAFAPAGTSFASALPPGLTTGVNAIWIGTQDDINSEFDNARYGNCAAPGVSGPIAALRALLNNQANWIRNNLTPPGFTVPTGCNYLFAICPTITVTNPGVTTGTAGTAFSQTFTSTGGVPAITYTTASTLPSGLSLSTGGVLSGTPTEAGTFPIIVIATDLNGCSGAGSTYTLVISCPAPVTGTATPASQSVCSGTAITTIVLSGAPAGAVYNWTRDNTVNVTGIASSGSGDISGTLTSSTAVVETVTFTITPTYYGTCTGTPYTATVTVNPAPTVVATPASQTVCNGTAITTIVLTGTGTTYNWTRDNTVNVTGIAASGSGDISGTLTSSTAVSELVTFTITPTAAGCNGTPITATVTVNPAPTTATAGPDQTNICIGGFAVMAANTPVSGTGAWTQTGGPVAANILSPGAPNTTINGLTTAGTYTFRWTISNAPCAPSFDEVDVVMNPNPAAFVIGGAGTFCPTGTTLTGPVDPNYTYQWGRTLFTAPFSNLGTAQTQAATASGVYQLVVTNQFGCSASTTAVVNVADYVFNGTIGAGDLQQTGRINRFAVVSTCAAPKACPGIFTPTGARFYDAYTITNPRNVPVCATIGLNSGCATNIFSVAYTGSFNPASLCTNYLADPGSSPSTSIFYEATIPANGTIVVIVHEVNVGVGCGSYTLTVDLPREAAGITATPSAFECSGTPITLTASTANTYLWSPGGATTQAIVHNTGVTNYSVTLGYGNNGCTATAAQTATSLNPTVNAVADQYYCSGSPATVSFTGTGATAYNWTNTNPAIGLAASGSGDLNFTATNATAAPISGTITVTPANGACNGTPITFTISVAPIPSITSVTGDAVCEPGGVVNLSAAGTGTINWWNASTGGVVVNTGTTYSPNITATTTYYVEAVTPAGPSSLLAMPAQSNTFPGNVRGYWFTAPTDFVITSLSVPTTASAGPMSIAVVKFNGNTPPPVFSATTNAFTTLFQTGGNPSLGSVPCNIPVAAGEVIGFLGYRGNINSYAPGDYNTTIAGFPVQLQRLGMQFPLSTSAPHDIWREFGAATSISRIEFEYSAAQTCNSAPRVPVTGTVNPVPVATATPSSQTVCSGPITTIVLTSTVPGTTFAWTRDNTVNVTGIAASGSGDISGTLTNNTFVPQTVTFTITPTSPDGCAGAPITATVTVNAVPTIVCPANITVSNTIGLCGNTVTYSPTITGIPAPTITYTFSGATTASGSGDGSGSFFNVGTTTVTITATNSCGTANCSFTVTVNDTENPTITCPGPVTVSCAALVPAPDPGSIVAADNCPGVVVTHISDVISGQTCANRYTVTRTYRATDAAGNFVECTQIITVDDQTPPTMTCPGPITVCGPGAVPLPDILSVTGVSDNCAGVVTVTHQGDVNNCPACVNVPYTITRTYRATDVCGNFTECTQIITVNPIPNAVATPPSQTICSGNAITTIVLTSAVSGTTYAWTRDNTVAVTGIAASGSGNISGSLTNTTFAPVTVTFTITPTANGCPGTPITATVLVNPRPNAIATPAAQTVCSGLPITTIALTSGVSGTTYAWTRNNTGTVTGIAASGTGNISGTLTNTTFAPITVTFTITPTANGCAGTPITATVLVNPTPNVSQGSMQVIITGNGNFADEVTWTLTNSIGTVVLTGGPYGFNPPPTPSATVPATNAPFSFFIEAQGTFNDNACLWEVRCDGVIVASGCIRGTAAAPVCASIGTLTVPGISGCGSNLGAQTICSGSAITPIVLVGSVAGTTFNWTRNNTATVTGIAASGTGNISGTLTNTTNAPITVTFTITPTANGCTGIPVTVNILVNPTPNAVATPPSQTICSSTAMTPIVLTGAVSGTTYAWTRDNVAAVTGIPASGTGNISGTLTNTTLAAVTVTFTITPTANGCVGPSITATVTVQAPLTITCPANITVPSIIGGCTAVVSYAPVITGTPAPTVTYAFTGATTGSGSGTGSGSTFNVGVTTVTITATNICGTVVCSFTITVTDSQLPVVTVPPANRTVCAGSNATFSVTATNVLSYQWQAWNGSAWVNIAGATASSYTVNNVTIGMNTNSYRVVLTGLCSVVNSVHATLYVNPLPTISLTASPLIALLPNQTTTITATVNPPGGTFVWSLNGTPISGVTGPVLGPININGIGIYRAVYTDPNGCVNTSATLAIGAQASNHLWVFPNPNTGQFNVRFFNQTGEAATLKVFNAMGQQVYTQSLTLGVAYSNINVNLGNVPAGIYIVKIVDGSGAEMAARRVVVYHQ